ncbi:FAD-dependent oxidoreductase [Pararoseomonas sp. SCSIO 73927]|uniref:FAD-dependent oxidoreductase n=1 Tax=Pararoseomonas sp. SCSIO 73927 TaxID=3114537 RepID=UPI0030D09099
MPQEMRADVLVVGSGPVGMVLAMDLASRGVDVIVAERRAPGEPPNVKCNHVSARSMEVFRRLGVVEAVRNTGLPADFPNDCAYRTTSTGLELSRIPIPCRRDRYTATGGPDTWWPTPEPPHRINQTFLEPVLFAQMSAKPGIRVLNRVAVEGFEQDREGVRATVERLEGGGTFHIACRYVVGCDGGRSTIRRAMGARLEGTPVVQRVQSTFIRAPDLIDRIGQPAWMLLSLNPRRSGTVVAIDGREEWLVHNHLHEHETEFDSVDRDWAIRTILGVGPEFRYEVISQEDWVGRRLVADRFRNGRAFLCGDAAHLWIPYAGYGMNAGIADAVNLSWQLAAVIRGWAEEGMLDAYEAERRPITEQVSRFAMGHALAMMRQRGGVPANIEAPGPEGDAARARLGQEAYDLNVQQYCCGGLNFGYFYPASPVIAHDGAEPPAYTMSEFTPSTVPGCRTPHLWLKDGRSLLDAMGPGYTLLRLDPALDTAGLEAAAARAGMPLTLLDLDGEDARAAGYDHPLVLSRPDWHVAWRGNAVPADPEALIDRLRGASTAATRRIAA